MQPIKKFFDGTCPVCNGMNYNGLYKYDYTGKKKVRFTAQQVLIDNDKIKIIDLIINTKEKKIIFFKNGTNRNIHKDDPFALHIKCQDCEYQSYCNKSIEIFHSYMRFDHNNQKYRIESYNNGFNIIYYSDFSYKLAPIVMEEMLSITKEEAVDLYDNYFLME